MKSPKLTRLLITALITGTGFLLNCMDVPRDNAADRRGDNYNNIYSDNRITEFYFGDLQVNGVIDHDAGTIAVPVLYGSDVTALAPEFTTNAESVAINSREQRSGITVNDYSEPLVYEVTARDGSYREYTVSVREVSIVSFRLVDPALPWENGTEGTIDYDNNTICIPVPFYMNITRLTAVFNSVGDVWISDTPQESGITEHDFTNTPAVPFIYEVVDANNVTEEYTVTAECKEPTVAHFAGSMGGVGSSDGTGGAASFRNSWGITSDMNNLYVADEMNHTIRKIEIATGIVTTLAGSPGENGYVDGIGTAARFSYPRGITTDGINLFVTDSNNHTIRKIVISSGAVTTVAGSGNWEDYGSTDGIGSVAKFYYPMGITTDGVNLYVADTENDTIRKVEISSGLVSTFAGQPNITTPYADDSDGTTWNGGSNNYDDIESTFFSPMGITTDGVNLYVSDTSYNTIRRIEISSGIVSTMAGAAGTFGSADDPDGTAWNDGTKEYDDIESTFFNPVGITADAENLYITDAGNNTIRRIVISSGVVSTFAGATYTYTWPDMPEYNDGMGSGAGFYDPRGITIRNGMLYVSDYGNSIIREISQDRMVRTLAGLVNESGTAGGTGTEARFTAPCSVTAYLTNIYVSDNGDTIRKIDMSSGSVTNFYYSPGSAFTGITTDGTYLYVCDYSIIDNFIFKIDISSGTLHDSIASGCDFPVGITTDGANLYVTDSSNNSVVRKIVISSPADNTVLAGSGSRGYIDGTGTDAEFYYPQGITTDGINLYVADNWNHTVRQIVIETRVVSTIAGSAGLGGHADDPDGYTNGIDSRLRVPTGITTDGANLYVTEAVQQDPPAESFIIRKVVVSSGVVTTLAGRFSIEGCNDGLASAALFNNPAGLVFSYSDQKLYICDQGNNAIRVINP